MKIQPTHPPQFREEKTKHKEVKSNNSRKIHGTHTEAKQPAKLRIFGFSRKLIHPQRLPKSTHKTYQNCCAFRRGEDAAAAAAPAKTQKRERERRAIAGRERESESERERVVGARVGPPGRFYRLFPVSMYFFSYFETNFRISKLVYTVVFLCLYVLVVGIIWEKKNTLNQSKVIFIPNVNLRNSII
jgi:hypothetical protein